jgi:MFS family permease
LSASSRVPALAPFRIRSYRFQWPADLATSWAFEMETLILSWYVLVETRSVLMLTLYASLQYVGTLLAPMFGVAGDRIGHRNLLCAMRAVYTTLATILMTFTITGVLTPVYVLAIAALMGIVRPSDLGVRSTLIGETMPADRLMGAMSIQRTTQDSARIAGALTGAGVVATLGMGLAYLVVVSLYAASFLLTLKAGGAASAHRSAEDTAGGSADPRKTLAKRSSPWRDLRAGVAYVWATPHLLAVMCIAFLVNLTAYPLVNGLLPYVAKAIYLTDQTGLGYLLASFACGALLGSVVLSRIGHAIRPGRMMIVFCAGWYAMVMVFAQMQSPTGGIPALMLAGLAQSLCMVPMSAMLLRNTRAQFRGRVMGIRMLMIYGVPVGLMTSGPLIGRFGYQTTATLYCVIGLAFTLLIAVRWRAHLWKLEAQANMR